MDTHTLIHLYIKIHERIDIINRSFMEHAIQLKKQRD